MIMMSPELVSESLKTDTLQYPETGSFVTEQEVAQQVLY